MASTDQVEFTFRQFLLSTSDTIVQDGARDYILVTILIEALRVHFHLRVTRDEAVETFYFQTLTSFNKLGYFYLFEDVEMGIVYKSISI